MAYIMSNTGTPSNKELDLVDLRMQKYKNEIETMLKTSEKTVDPSMEAELSAMVNGQIYNQPVVKEFTDSSLLAAPIDLSIEEISLHEIDP
jgi:hypothetical protein